MAYSFVPEAIVQRWKSSQAMRLFNKVLAKVHSPVDLKPRFDYREDMVSLEQAGNFELLITELLDQQVPGDFVEVGCYTGNTASLFATMLRDLDPARKLHVFDRFDIELGASKGIRQQFDEAMFKAAVLMPEVHAGDVFETLPGKLPERIAFAHIDLGTGGDVELHVRLVTHALEAVYPRMTKGGIIVIMDYHVPDVTINGYDANPGARLACDAFMNGKPEQVRVLYGGPCSHAYLRKV